MRLLQRLQIDKRIGHVVKLSVKLDGILCPDGLEHLQKLIRLGAALLHVGAGSIHFVFGPAEAETHAQASVRKVVDGRQTASEHYRVVIRDIEHASSQKDSAG